MLPASFLVDGTGIIRACTRSDDVGGFFAPQQVLQQLEKLAAA